MILRLLRVTVLFLAMVLVALTVAGVWLVRRPWPQTEGTLYLEGLYAPVEVFRDAHGIPYIYAQNTHDLFLAQGFVHAQDRLWQMDFHRHLGMGRLSEIVGEAALEADIFLRTVGVNRGAQQDYAHLDQATKDILQAYADGVNAYIATHRGRYPVEYRILGIEPKPWSPVDTVAWGKILQWNLSISFRTELLFARLIEVLGPERAAQVFPGYLPDANTILHEGEISLGFPDLEALETALARVGITLDGATMGLGSNNWVLAPSRSATGRPVLANDPHVFYTTPPLWYLNALHAPDIHVAGASFVGVPGVIIGHNARIAWGVTNLAVDVMDLYIERLNPNNPNEYEVNGTYVPLEIIREEIYVKGRSEPVVIEVKRTRHGPLLNDVLEGLTQPLALKWLDAEEPTTLIRAIYPLNMAQNWEEFCAALRYWDSPMQNFVYADVEGNIGYYGAGKVPIRARGTGDVPVPGWTDDYEWVGFVPFEELPHVFNPARGYVVTANQNPVPDTYPYYIATFYASPNRARRIEAWLQSREIFHPDDMAAIQGDDVSIPAQQLVPYLLAVQHNDALIRRAQDILADWDFRLRADSAAAGIFEVVYWKLIESVVADDLSPDLRANYLLHHNRHVQFIEWLLQQPPDHPWWDDVTTPQRETRDEIIARAFEQAVQWWREEAGDAVERWTWGRIHRTVFRHLVLGGVPLLNRFFDVDVGATPGDGQTPNANSFPFGKSFSVDAGPSYREIFDVGNWDNARVIISGGQSGHVFHRHYGDMAPLWSNIEYVPLYWSRETTEQHAVSRLELRPSQTSP